MTDRHRNEVSGTAARSGIAARASLILFIVCAVQFLDAMDIASMGPALPKIQTDLGMSPSALQWVVSAYVLGFGGFLLLGGRLADLLERRRLLVTWLVIFAIASIAGGLVTAGAPLVGARLLKGVSAAFTAPTALAILLDTYRDEDERNRALGHYLAIASVGFVLGLVVGGFLATASWRITLFMPAVIAIVVAIMAQAVILPGRHGERLQRPDLLGAVSVTLGLLAIVFAVSRAADSGWLAPLTISAAVAGVLLISAFIMIEKTARAPLIPLGIFSRPQFAAANTCMLFQGCYVAFQFVSTLYYQQRLGWSPWQAGAAFVIGGLIVGVAARWFAGVVGRRGAWPLASFGLALQAVSYIWFALGLGHVAIYALLVVQQLLGGIGFAAAYPAMNITAVASAAADEQGLASGIFIAASQIGTGLVVGVTATVLSYASSAGLAGYRAGLWFVIGVTAAVSLLAATTAIKHRRRTETAIKHRRRTE
ncbi:MFS transporter [Kribbella sp. VKM Ac-2566]|uniref:MFS transporter n=1 Tax=Kribbella sp. VKM Ac-2566 TaxID=2512218 RepID=UPI0010635D2E|nr:MFS transporter [Kribbella sp. VKM Ac-2566]TDX08298.1 putative MFS family arabinose efflux permease [Kribbella sp. VKM Ac-2566]